MHLLKRSTTIMVMMYALTSALQAQNFNYSLARDSSVYSVLTGATTIAGDSSWSDDSFGVKLPFSINFCGTDTDTLIIEPNGYIVFNKASELSIVAFNNFRCNKDTSNSYQSFISFQNSGSAGNRIFKVQFSGLSQNLLSNYDYLNYQLWIYENGDKIEFHAGPSSYAWQAEQTTLIGIINRNMNGETNAGLIIGSTDAPSFQTVSTELVNLNTIPSAGIILTLTPLF